MCSIYDIAPSQLVSRMLCTWKSESAQIQMHPPLCTMYAQGRTHIDIHKHEACPVWATRRTTAQLSDVACKGTAASALRSRCLSAPSAARTRGKQCDSQRGLDKLGRSGLAADNRAPDSTFEYGTPTKTTSSVGKIRRSGSEWLTASVLPKLDLVILAGRPSYWL
jgi:hypothetical protein